MINIYVLISLLITLAVLGTFAFYILPMNIREVNKQTNDRLLFAMRVVILSITLSILLFSVLPVAYQFMRLNMPTEMNLQNLSGLSGALRTMSFGFGWIGIHVLSGILIKRDKDKEL